MTNKVKLNLIDLLKKPLIAFVLSFFIAATCGVTLFSLSVNATSGIVTTSPVTTTAPITSLPPITMPSAIITTPPPEITSPAQTNADQSPTTSEPIVTTVPYEVPGDVVTTTNNGLLGLLDVNDNNGTLELILVITILSLAPSILILMTSFTRIIIVFSLMRNAIGVQQTPPNQVLVGLALFLTLFIMSPVLKEINTVAYVPYQAGEVSTLEAVKLATHPLKSFMLKQTTNDSMSFFLQLANMEMPDVPEEELAANIPLEVVAPAYIISEIKTAFSIGFLLFMPFLIIDIVVSSTLMSLGMIMLPPAMISLPFKILLFILVDGWRLLAGALVIGFNV